MELYIITFKNGNYTVAAYNEFRKLNMRNIKLSPVPFAIRGECDVCIKTIDYETLKEIIRQSRGRYPVDKVYSSIRINGIQTYKILPLIIE